MKVDPSAAKAIASKTLNLDVRLVGNLLNGKSTSRKSHTVWLFLLKGFQQFHFREKWHESMSGNFRFLKI